MKTKEELTAVKEKAEAKNEKVRKLTDEELRCSGGASVVGGFEPPDGISFISFISDSSGISGSISGTDGDGDAAHKWITP